MRRTATFDRWLRRLDDRQGKARIAAKLMRLADGSAQHTRYLRAGIWELKINSGPGYRVYFLRNLGDIVLLCAGTKSTQRRDIGRAIRLAKQQSE